MAVRGSSDNWIQSTWYGASPLYWLLLPLTVIFAMAVAARRWLYARGILSVHRVGVPVIIVGNLSAGGTGKTPVTLWLASALKRGGFRPGIVSRGYGGDVGPLPLEVTGSSDPSIVGDEALLLATHSGCTTVVHPDRVAAAREAIRLGADVVLSDDGLQHYRLGRNVELAVVDAERGFGNGALLPAGPLREPVSRLRDVDAVLLHCQGAGHCGAPVEVKDSTICRFRLRPTAVCGLDGARRGDLDDFAGRSVHAVAGIGHPERFFSMLASRGITVIRHPLPDHAEISEDDIRFNDGLDVLMTEKDAVKCRGFVPDGAWYVSVDVAFEDQGGDALIALVRSKIDGAGAAP